MQQSVLKCQGSNNARVRLVGGSNAQEGRLEMLASDGRWGAVCTDNFWASSAAVVCKELCGYLLNMLLTPN